MGLLVVSHFFTSSSHRSVCWDYHFPSSQLHLQTSVSLVLFWVQRVSGRAVPDS